MQETYTSDFPGLKHRENIRPRYIMTSAAAGSDNQLNGLHNLSQVRVLHFSYLIVSPRFFFLFVRSFVLLAEGGIILSGVTWSNMQPVGAEHSKRESQEAAWPGGFGLYTRHTLLKG